jgi:uncharacterized membrane protein YqiK
MMALKVAAVIGALVVLVAVLTLPLWWAVLVVPEEEEHG